MKPPMSWYIHMVNIFSQSSLLFYKQSSVVSAAHSILWDDYSEVPVKETEPSTV